MALGAYLAHTLNSDLSHMYGRGLYSVLVGKPQGKERDHIEDLDVDGKIMLKRTL